MERTAYFESSTSSDAVAAVEAATEGRAHYLLQRTTLNGPLRCNYMNRFSVPKSGIDAAVGAWRVHDEQSYFINRR
jgi:hypothetical protein